MRQVLQLDKFGDTSRDDDIKLSPESQERNEPVDDRLCRNSSLADAEDVDDELLFGIT